MTNPILFNGAPQIRITNEIPQIELVEAMDVYATLEDVKSALEDIFSKWTVAAIRLKFRSICEPMLDRKREHAKLLTNLQQTSKRLITLENAYRGTNSAEIQKDIENGILDDSVDRISKLRGEYQTEFKAYKDIVDQYNKDLLQWVNLPEITLKLKLSAFHVARKNNNLGSWLETLMPWLDLDFDDVARLENTASGQSEPTDKEKQNDILRNKSILRNRH